MKQNLETGIEREPTGKKITLGDYIPHGVMAVAITGAGVYFNSPTASIIGGFLMGSITTGYLNYKGKEQNLGDVK